jgi:hypothetical protein
MNEQLLDRGNDDASTNLVNERDERPPERLEGGVIGKLHMDGRLVLSWVFWLLLFSTPLFAVHEGWVHDDSYSLHLGLGLLVLFWSFWVLIVAIPIGRGCVYSQNSLCVVGTGGSGFCFQTRRKLKWTDIVEITQFYHKENCSITLTWKVPECWGSWTCSGMICRPIGGLTREEVREFMDFFQQRQISVEKIIVPRVGIRSETLFRVHPSDYPLEALYFGEYHQKQTHLVWFKLIYGVFCLLVFSGINMLCIFFSYWYAFLHLVTLWLVFGGLVMIDFAAGLRFDLLDKSLVFSYRWFFRKRQRIIELEDIVEVALERASIFNDPYPMILTLKLRNRVISVPLYDSPQTEGNLNEFCRIVSLERGIPLAWRRIGL